MKICHLTSAHNRYDSRIFWKQLVSLSKHYRACLIVADGLGEAETENIKIYDVGKPQSRLQRIVKTTGKIYRKALEINADIYQLHDPELIPVGVKLKKRGKKLIFDAHEDVPVQLLYKPYLNKPLRKILSESFKFYQRQALKHFDFLFAATEIIRDKLKKINPNVIDIKNYPVLEEIFIEKDFEARENLAVYIGGLNTVRGTKDIVRAVKYLKTDVKIALAGKFDNIAFENEVKALPEWQKIDYKGYLSRQEIKNLLSQAKIGLITLHPIKNYQEALPVKMFEYMAAGLAIVSSDIDFWKKNISDKVAIFVNPFKPQEIAQAIDFLVNNPQQAKKMGETGQKLILEKFNWKKEEEKMLKIYKQLLSD